MAESNAAESDCIFCRIIAGEIPCHRVYEDGQVLAFLDVGPLARGHVLVVPKEHYVTVNDMPAELAGACMKAVARIGPVVQKETAAAGWNLLQNNGEAAGQVVQHVHFHIIPRHAGDGLGYRWNAGQIDHADAKVLASKLAQAVKVD